MSTIKLVYVAGKYRAPTPWAVEQNIRDAEALGYALTCAGLYPVIPHANTRGYFASGQQDDAFWLAATMELLRRCDGIAMVEGWERSQRARAEHSAAVARGMPILNPRADMATFRDSLQGPR